MSLRRGLSASVLAAAVLVSVPGAGAQVAGSTAGELIVSPDGQPVSPWVAKQACVAGTDTCKTMIVNPVTNEIAKLGDQLSSRFELTGNGQEVKRAESALAKAARLQAQ